MAAEPPWYRTRRGIVVVGLYAGLTVAGVTISTGVAFASFVFGPPAPDGGPLLRIPPYIYLYGFLGAMAYAFTSVIAKFERGTAGVVRVGLRVLAALPLAAGVFLLAGALGIEPSDGRLVAGLAFLVGLYVNLTLKALGGLAERLLGVTSDGGTGGSETD